MKQKINVRLILIAFLATIVTTISVTVVHYRLFQEQVKHDLRLETELLCEADIEELIAKEAVKNNADIRITWIGKDGEVLFDNDANASQLTNHMNRPEVKAAFETGQGEATRESETMKMRTFYYARLMEDGTVLRISKEAVSLVSVFLSVFPIILVIILVITIVCVAVSHFLTKQLLRPIERMAQNLDEAESEYKELTPFMEHIREQHANVLASAKSRQDFTANVSHELKTPLTAISGYAELIENRMVSQEKEVHFAAEIRKNADRLVSLINDIIRLSELDQKENTPDFEQLDLYAVAEERLELLRENARSKNIQVELHGGCTYVLSNKGMLTELIDNLGQNAIRYNVVNGKVDITVEKEGTHAVLTVEDTGIGIPPKDQERVFERFYRVDKSRSKETGGTGLGLAIVKHIVELHDGEIQLKSEVNKGTQIRILL